MTMTVHLLGPPRIERDHQDVTRPRGNKAWGLLAYLARAERPITRERLATMLFADAEDPMGALRWNLSQLRRTLGDHLHGDPVRLELPEGTVVDTEVLAHGSWVEAADLPSLGGEFLEGLTFANADAFQLWLDAERRHVSSLTNAVLREASLGRLARGDADGAVELATRMVTRDPLDENAHVVLIRCLRAAGLMEEARDQVGTATELLRRELGVEPSAALATAAGVPGGGEPGSRGRATVLAQLEAGQAAMAAGALDAGIDSLRRATVAARGGEHRDLLARALVELGSALVHSARGTDEDGAAALHEAIALAEDLDDPSTVALATRELAYVEVLRGRYERAGTWLEQARAVAQPGSELAWVHVVEGMRLSDTGEHRAGFDVLRQGVEAAASSGDRRAGAFARSLLGRLHLVRGEHEPARDELERSLELVRDESWTGFLPWPEALRAGADLGLGRLDPAAEGFEHAYVLGTQLGDPCWESISLRGLGLVAAHRGDTDRALQLLGEAPRVCRRLPDAYLWVEAYALDALCDVALTVGAESAPRWVDALREMAARTGMRELLARAHLYAAQLGAPGAAEAASILVQDIDNPALRGALTTEASTTEVSTTRR